MDRERRYERALGLNMQSKGSSRATTTSSIQFYKKKSRTVLQHMRNRLLAMGRNADRPVGDYIAEWEPWTKLEARRNYIVFLNYAMDVELEYQDWLEEDVYDL